MPRKITGTGFESSTSRAGLKHQKHPHRFRLEKGLSIGYYKPTAQGVDGSWVAMAYDPKATPKERRKTLGLADDFKVADDNEILNWGQAQQRAREWHLTLRGALARSPKGNGPRQSTYTVQDAWDEYIENATGRNVRGVKIMCQCFDAHIKEVLGALALENLTTSDIEGWLFKLASSPRRSGKKVISELEARPKRAYRKKNTPEAKAKSEAKSSKASKDPLDAIRARRDSANRVYSNLKAALNYAVGKHNFQVNTPWKRVPPLEKTTSTRIRTLDNDEKWKLINACSDELRPLVIAGLLTGARYGELSKVRVFEYKGNVLHIQYGKGKGGYVPRDIMLNQEAVNWFLSHVEGRTRDELMFVRSGVDRTRRKIELADWAGWAEYDQIYAMQQAVKKAGIAPVTFHELRHTFASDLLNDGMYLSYVAKQLGHKDTRMVERHYGHIANAAMRAAVNKMKPILGLPNATTTKNHL